jgi:hypothetical protein
MAFSKVKHPNLYEINTRLLLSTYRTGGNRATLKDIPNSYWQDLADRGMDWVWLMGVWSLTEKQINPSLIPVHMMADFKSLVPDIREADIDGSTYAIDDYVVDPIIGGDKELHALRQTLAELGIRLMLDFIPNHYGAHTHFIHTHPQYFIEIDPKTAASRHDTFYTPITKPNSYFAHGKDPYFDAWQDTIQVNYASEETREWMTSQLMQVASKCDGVRCDMAMLPVKKVFEKTWGEHINWQGGEFWPNATTCIKKAHPQFTFLAEVYWNMESELLNSGFDYCYDKTFYDRLTDPPALNAHFDAETWYLEHTARFLENHDEERIASRLDLRQHMAASALVAFSPGLRFWHMGQWEGRTKRIPVQITRQPQESCGCLLYGGETAPCTCIATLYRNLFNLANQDVFKQGTWENVHLNSETYPGVFLWKWRHRRIQMVIAINYNSEEIQLNHELAETLNLNSENQLFPAHTDSYNSLLLRQWDVRCWSYSSLQISDDPYHLR